MSSFFDSMKKSLGMSRSKVESKGHILGGAPPQVQPVNSTPQSSQAIASSKEVVDSVSEEYWEFELQFRAEKMGMQIREHKGAIVDPNDPTKVLEVSQAMVSAVAPGSEAFSLGILDEDIIVALNGHNLTHFDDFYNFIVGTGRPVMIQFLRKRCLPPPPILRAAQSNPPAASRIPTRPQPFPQPSSSANLPAAVNNKASLSSRMFAPFASTPAPPRREMTEEEKEAQRLAMRRAADQRAQHNNRYVTGGTRKTGASSSSSRVPLAASSSSGKLGSGDREDTKEEQEQISEETLRAIQEAKKVESQIEKQMGYSPFRPHMSFTGSGSIPAPPPTSISPPPPVGSASSSPVPHTAHQPSNSSSNSNSNSIGGVLATSQTSSSREDKFCLPPEMAEDVQNEVDSAFAMLLSLGGEGAGEGLIQGVVQTVHKLMRNLVSNPDNPKFRSVRLSNATFSAKVGDVPGGLELLVAGGWEFALTEGGEGLGVGRDDAAFLVHMFTPEGRCRAEYTLERIQDLVDMQGA
eukprot:gene27143-32789_t